jgi:hypothetical protein
MAVARPAHQHDGVRVVSEGRRCQRTHQLAIHRRDFEVEAGQVAMHREPCRMHLVAGRGFDPAALPRRSLEALGLQEVILVCVFDLW